MVFWRLRPPSAAWHLTVGANVRVEGIVWLPGRGRVVLGDRVRLLGRRSPIELRAHAGGEIVIGDDVVIEAGASIEATRSVRVEAGAHLGPFCKVLDNHFHQTTGDRGQRPTPVPVRIGEAADVGPRAVLLPGASIGSGARVAAARVVSFRLPPGMDQRLEGEGPRQGAAGPHPRSVA